uniref:Uncharacterized protein n=1 Tax=Mycena chlorophos TaxID=658473 RepID=A0ABQ0LCT8_MYCCL|nr:predicted protein [Mycena chlorophos]
MDQHAQPPRPQNQVRLDQRQLEVLHIRDDYRCATARPPYNGRVLHLPYRTRTVEAFRYGGEALQRTLLRFPIVVWYEMKIAEKALLGRDLEASRCKTTEFEVGFDLDSDLADDGFDEFRRERHHLICPLTPST